ncbi:hypothetical protein NQZ79_g3857 [Umbelopsis isabellina]|nr:hypothetical protein NQZ79_g3857 [Umbelopsis isabellina]
MACLRHFKFCSWYPAPLQLIQLFSLQCIVMSSESTPLISTSRSGYSSIGTNVSDDNTALPSIPAPSSFDDLISPVADIAIYLSAAKRLENRGSVARDHLAVTQLFRINEPRPIRFLGGEALGAYLILMGIILVVYAAIRFFHCQEAMTKGKFPATTNVPVFTSSMLLILCIALLFMNTNHPV